MAHPCRSECSCNAEPSGDDAEHQALGEDHATNSEMVPDVPTAASATDSAASPPVGIIQASWIAVPDPYHGRRDASYQNPARSPACEQDCDSGPPRLS
jgi:hypothetical protein